MIRICLILLSLLCAAQVQAAPLPLESVDDLLKLIEQGRMAESKEHRLREQRFLKEKNKQKAILRETIGLRKKEELLSNQLEKDFDKNEAEIAKLKIKLNERLGSMKELYGHLQETTASAASVIKQSLTSAEIKDRDQFFNQLMVKVSNTDTLASIEDIEALWYEMQREIIESGKITRFRAPVTDSEGQTREREIIRLGNFNLVSEGKYLQYIHETDRLIELPKQPPSHYQKSARTFQQGEDALEGIGIDPTRGAILTAIVESPDLYERVEQGGFIGYTIIALGVIAALVILERCIYLFVVSLRINKQMKEPNASEKNPLGRIFKAYEHNKSVDVETLELKLGEAILKERSPLERFLPLLKIIAVVAPLLGLLGTVTGMINTFQSITLFGTGDPKLMAGGISQALVTTVLGLCVAIPTLFFHSVVNSRYKQILMILEEQSTGLVAERAEKVEQHLQNG